MYNFKVRIPFGMYYNKLVEIYDWLEDNEIHFSSSINYINLLSIEDKVALLLAWPMLLGDDE